MMKNLFSRFRRRDKNAADSSVLIKDYEGQSQGQGDESPGSSVVPLRGGGREQPVARKKDSAERFTESVDKLVERLEGINDNLSRQTQQNERLVQKLDQLPTLLSPVPDAVNQQRQALLQMTEQLGRKIQQDAATAELLAKLPEYAGRQSDSLEAINERLCSAADVDEKMAATFAKVSESLGKLDADVTSEIEWLQKMSQSFTDNEKLLKETLTTQQRRFFRVFAVTVVVSLVAVTGLVIGLIMLLYR